MNTTTLPKVAKVLLLMGGNRNSGVGEQFLQTMLSQHPVDKLHRISLIRNRAENRTDLFPYPTTVLHSPASVRPIASTLDYLRFRRKGLNQCMEKIASLVREQNIDLIWVVMNTSVAVEIAAVLPDFTDVPYVTHAWDTPRNLAINIKLDPVTHRTLIGSFNKAISRAATGVGVSQRMKATYEQQFGVEFFSMVFCPPLNVWRDPKPPRQPDEPVNVVFAGSLYAYREWNAFLDAVESRNKSGTHPQVNVKCVGVRSRFVRDRRWVEYQSTLPIEEAADLVNQSDVAYLPYWMDKKNAYRVTSAFPGKLSFYTSSGTPVFFHGPVQSTPTDFLKKHAVGMMCSSHKSADILKTLDALFAEDFRSQYPRQRLKTLNEVFHPDRCVEIFNSAISSAISAASSAS